MKLIFSSQIWRIALAAALLFTGSVMPAAAKGQPSKHDFFRGHKVAANEVIVKFHPHAAPSAKSQVEQDEDVESTEVLGDGKMTLFRSRSRDVNTLISNLSRRGDVQFVEPNYMLQALNTPNDTSFYSEWAMQNTGQTVNNRAGVPGADISATLAWDITTGSAANVVAVVDSGVDYTHPDLAANIWTAPQAFTVIIGGSSITCPSGSHGFNAITNTCDPRDDNNHGTHVSGTIGAVGNDGYNIAGINWTASIMGLKFIDASGSGTTANAINSIEFAIQARQALGSGANVRILSNSWGGGGFSQAMLDVINKANQNGMLFVAAAGNAAANNDTTPFYPADYAASNVVAVAATDSSDLLASFSNYGPTTVHLGAPGVNIISTTLNGGYAYGSGTSMATPHVSGTAALMLAANGALTPGQLKLGILGSVDPIPALAGKTVTGGRLNANRAVQAALTPAGFAIDATPASLSVVQGSATTCATTINAVNGFSGPVSLSVTGLPAGATASFSPNPTTSSSTLTVTTSSITPTGTYTLTITGTSDMMTAISTVQLTVTPGPSFSLSATPPSATVSGNNGGTATYNLGITPLDGFNGSVTLSVSGLPYKSTASFSPNPATGASTLTVKVAQGTRKKLYTLTVTGKSGLLTQTTKVTLAVQ